jgi:hydrogenase/urease accessory protein HupE
VSDADDGRTRDLVLRFSGRPIGALKFRVDLFRDAVKSAKHIADVSEGRTLIFERDRVEADWTAKPSWIRRFGAFAWLGIEHILTGWDHLTFLIALLLIAAKVGSVVRLVTAFTVAHSITLGLTALRVIGPPSFVEPLIAASIVYVAVENLCVKDEARWRWMVVFAFGLVHGMGFGGALLEMELTSPVTALLGFNVGVELGQLAVVAVVFPLLAVARRRETLYRKGVLRVGSIAAGCAGLFWFAQRIMS